MLLDLIKKLAASLRDIDDDLTTEVFTSCIIAFQFKMYNKWNLQQVFVYLLDANACVGE